MDYDYLEEIFFRRKEPKCAVRINSADWAKWSFWSCLCKSAGAPWDTGECLEVAGVQLNEAWYGRLALAWLPLTHCGGFLPTSRSRIAHPVPAGRSSAGWIRSGHFVPTAETQRNQPHSCHTKQSDSGLFGFSSLCLTVLSKSLLLPKQSQGWD